MAEKIKVNTARLNSDSSQVGECIQAMKTGMEKMKTSVSQLNSMWEGDGKEAFSKAFQDDMNLLNTIIMSLEKFQQKEMEARQKYDNCENKVGGLISGIRV